MHFLLNVYFDSQQSTLKYLKDIKVNLNNVTIMTGDFNICDSNWDPFYPYHSIHADTLCEISDSLSLELLEALIITKSCQTYRDHQTMLL